MALTKIRVEELEEAEDLELELEANLNLDEMEEGDIEDDEVPEASAKRVRHKRSQIDWVFVHNPAQGWMRTNVPIRNVPMMLRSGARRRCGDCGERECLGPMYCPKKALPSLQCEFCGRWIPDKLPTPTQNNRPTPPGAVQSDVREVDPKRRLQARLEAHQMSAHPQESVGLNLDPEKFRELMR